jgi:hypothetical protein
VKSLRASASIAWAFLLLQKSAPRPVAEFGGPFVLQACQNCFGFVAG